MKRRHSTNIMLIVGTVLLGVLLLSLGFNKNKKVEKGKQEKSAIIETQKPIPNPAIQAENLLSVPYTVQAPLVNWNIHEESCEEAALLMVHYYIAGSQQQVIPPATANQELINLTNWQKSNYGKEKDLNLYEVGKLAKDYYGYSYQVTEDVTATEIKKAISKGNPVLVPVITHALKNPHYGPNPSYHILVIKGYNQNGIITNDAGVKEGRDYFYSWNILWQAIDAQSKQMNQGRDMLVVTM